MPKAINLKQARMTKGFGTKLLDIAIENAAERVTDYVRVWKLSGLGNHPTYENVGYVVEARRYGGWLPNSLFSREEEALAMNEAARLVAIYIPGERSEAS